MSKIRVLAIIPARGGSKGIPGKNLACLAGKPLVAWSIEAAKNSGLVDRVVVSTDDQKIAEVAGRYGAEVVIRPANISGDAASSESALLQCLEFLKKSDGEIPEIIVFLQCTSPLTLPVDIDGTIQTLLDTDADSALAVSPFHYFLWKKAPSGEATGINHDKSVRLRRQDQSPQSLETGAVYVMRTAGFLQCGHRFFGKIALYDIPVERCWEIDEPIDLEIAEVMMRHRLQSQRVLSLPEHLGGVVLDFDGVLTDNKVAVSQDGSEQVSCSRSDGWGLAELRDMGVPIVVISTEQNPVVTVRCRKLRIECLQGVDDKLAALQGWAAENNADLKNIIYVGNDVNDSACLKAVGCPVVVADSFPDVFPLAHIVLQCRGGEGALRELVELIKHKNRGNANV